MVSITEMIIPQGRKNRPGLQNNRLYITIHETGNTSPTANARNHAQFLLGNDAQNEPVSWHYTVDDVSIFQHLPTNESAFHAGDGRNGTGNRHSIGIEICVNNGGNFVVARQNAANLVANLMYQYNIPISNVVQHFKWNRKNCPQNMRRNNNSLWNEFIDKTMNIFNENIQTENNNNNELMTNNVSEWAIESWKWAWNTGLINNSDAKSIFTAEQIASLFHRFYIMYIKND